MDLIVGNFGFPDLKKDFVPRMSVFLVSPTFNDLHLLYGASVINLVPSFGIRSGHTRMGFDSLFAVSAVSSYVGYVSVISGDGRDDIARSQTSD